MSSSYLTGSTNSDLSAGELTTALAELEREEERLMGSLAVRDPYFWMTQCTKTRDEQHPVPYKPFPDKPYIRLVLNYLLHEGSPVRIIKKSRTMMASWTVSAWAAHFCFTRPATRAVFQSQDERRAVTDIEYCKELWKNSLPVLKEQWPVAKAIEKQAAHELEMANGSVMVAISRDPNAIRSAHPSIVVLDEAAFLEQGEESYNTAIASKCLFLVALSSAHPGWFADMTGASLPVPFPAFEQVRSG